MKHKILRALEKMPLTSDQLHELSGNGHFQFTARLIHQLLGEGLMSRVRTTQSPTYWQITAEGQAALAKRGVCDEA